MIKVKGWKRLKFGGIESGEGYSNVVVVDEVRWNKEDDMEDSMFGWF